MIRDTAHSTSVRRRNAPLVVAALAAVALAGCAAGGGSTTTVIQTQAPPAAAGHDAAASTTSAAPADHTVAASSRPQVFQGTGQKDLGSITVPVDSTISWKCPSCGNTNFIINNANSDVDNIPTNGLDQTQGVDPIPAGSYHTVVVDTTGGPWTVAIGTTAPAPSDSGASAPTSPQQPAPDTGITQCDANVSVSVAGCTFAENTFYEYWSSQGAGSVSVYDPGDHSHHTVTCSTDSSITCAGDQGATVQFSRAAIDAYTQDQADAYARSGKLGP